MKHDENYEIDLLLVHYQNIAPIIEHREQLKTIMSKSRSDNCIDAYLLGYMQGKRAERARKKARITE